MRHSLSDIARQFDLEIDRDTPTEIIGICGLLDDLPEHLSFVISERHVASATNSRIAAFVCRPEQAVPGKINLFHPQPEFMIAQIAALFLPSQLGSLDGVHETAQIATNTDIENDVFIGANVVIGETVRISSGVRIFPNVVVMDRVIIGNDCTIYPNCTIREDSVLGDRVILQPGVTIGGDGYGYVSHNERHMKIPQLGNVVLEDDVEIGANSTVDRARFSETRIGRGTKVDNLVMIGHNVTTGGNCLIVSQVGLSGSTRLGQRVTLGGQVGVAGHLNITDDVTVLGKSGITKDVPEPGVYAGMPLRPVKLWRKAIAKLYAGLR